MSRINRARQQDEARQMAARLEETARKFVGTEMTFMGSIPEDGCIYRAVRARQAVTEAFPGAPASRSLARVAESLEASTGQERERPAVEESFVDRLKRWFRRSEPA